MITKTYEFAGYTFKTYYKKAGMGYEVGLTSGNKTYFVGNFIRPTEAKKWWGFFNKEVTSFYRKFNYADNAPRDFYGQFMANYLYKEYYEYLYELFEGYDSKYNKAYQKDFRRYEKLMKDFTY